MKFLSLIIHHYVPIRRILFSKLFSRTNFSSASSMFCKLSVSKPYITSTPSFKLISNGCVGGGSSFILNFGNKSYLFNCCEENDRILFVNPTVTFLTSPLWHNMANLRNIFFNQDLACPIVIGSEQCMPYYKMMTTLFQGDFPNIKLQDFYSDQNLEVICVKLSPSFLHNPKKYSTIKINGNEVDLYSKNETDFPDVKRTRIELNQNFDTNKESNVVDAFVFVLKITDKAPKIVTEKLVEFNVPPKSSLISHLQMGNSVTLDDGSVVKSSDVSVSSQKGPFLLVVELPTYQHLTSLVESKELTSFIESLDLDTNVIIVHLSSDAIIKDELYKNWLKLFTRFGCNAKHLLLNSSNQTSLVKCHLFYHNSLNLINKSIYPLLWQQKDILSLENSSAKPSEESQIHPESHSVLSHMKEEKLLIQDEVTRSSLDVSFYRPDSCIEFNLYDLMQKTMRPDLGSLKLKNSLTKNILFKISKFHEEKTPHILQASDKYPKIRFFGTSSAALSSYRGVSCYQIETEPGNYILLDCGQGSLGQMYRFFGPERLDTVLRNTKMVFLSHHHADHCFGLPAILLQRKRAFQKIGCIDIPALHLLTSVYVLNVFLKYHSFFQDILSDVVIVPVSYVFPSTDNLLEVTKALCQHCKIDDIKCPIVFHTKTSRGIVIEKDGWRIAYSGDAFKSDSLIYHAKNADLLIHEATFSDDLIEDAIFKKHCTISQALSIADQMQAKFVVLTHFSSRYSKIPLIYPRNYKLFNQKKAAVAFDNMEINLETMHHLPTFFELQKELFSLSFEEMELKNEKKSIKKIKKRKMSYNADSYK